jgi:polysaccharide biosynthesis protein PslG
MRMSGKIRAFAATSAVVAVALWAAPAAQAVPGKFWGVVPQATPTAEQFQRLSRGGVDSVRVPIVWGSAQSSAGAPIDWSGVDAMVRGAALARLEVLPFVFGAPAWIVPQAVVPGTGGLATAPRNLPVKTGAQRSAWQAFLRLAVARYGPNGSFWLENPSVPRKPIRVWQIWNEPNFKYFVARPNPVEYGKLVNISYTALRSVDPGAKVILAGLFSEPREALFKARPRQAYFGTDFLERMYESTPGVRSRFVGTALHPYTGSYKELGEDIEAFRAVMKEHGDAGKGLWVTEVSWSSQPPAANNSFAKGPRGQVKQLKGAFGLFKRGQAKWRLQRIYWFSVDDQPGSCNFCDGSGLFAAGFVPKRSWFAYVGFAGGRPN